MGRICWLDDISRKLLNIVVGEKNRGVSKYQWPNIAKMFNVQTGLLANAKQTANHYNDLKDKYKCWEELQNMTRISYDSRTAKLDVAEKSLERFESWMERNPKYGKKVSTTKLENAGQFHILFDGKCARGVGGCFSRSMGKCTSYLTKNIDDLTINEDEGSGDNDDDEENEDHYDLSPDDEIKAPQISTFQKVYPSVSNKRKCEDIIEHLDLKRRQTSFYKCIQLLTNTVGSSFNSLLSKAEMINQELTRLEVAEKYDDAYFVKAIKYLSDENRAANFLTLKHDTQKWIFLKEMDE